MKSKNDVAADKRYKKLMAIQRNKMIAIKNEMNTESFIKAALEKGKNIDPFKGL